jgi:SAM-dependent methyltransferase
MIKKHIIRFAGDQLYFNIRWLFKYGRPYWPIRHYYRIEGWLSELEACALYDVARQLPQESPVIVELGSWKGKSSVILAQGIHQSRAGRIFCIDPFDVSCDIVCSSKSFPSRRSIRDCFDANLRAAGVADHIQAIATKSHIAVRQWKLPVDLLFIDADHAYEAVQRDFREWSPFVKPGGFIALHDVHPHPRPQDPDGPGRVARESICSGEIWTEVRIIDSLCLARKKKRIA